MFAPLFFLIKTKNIGKYYYEGLTIHEIKEKETEIMSKIAPPLHIMKYVYFEDGEVKHTENMPKMFKPAFIRYKNAVNRHKESRFKDKNIIKS